MSCAETDEPVSGSADSVVVVLTKQRGAVDGVLSQHT